MLGEREIRHRCQTYPIHTQDINSKANYGAVITFHLCDGITESPQAESVTLANLTVPPSVSRHMLVLENEIRGALRISHSWLETFLKQGLCNPNAGSGPPLLVKQKNDFRFLLLRRRRMRPGKSDCSKLKIVFLLATPAIA